ncbi:MAG: site-specific integrase [Ectothiorhodospiraceae bacterium]|nr:site-specific integrase [Ectothiorhodospiraceae bacterium]MCH8505431.1 site-specific integrase [Ectothiorhodospiraceae bacterium]
MASYEKRGTKWRVKVRRLGYPEQTDTFYTKAEARTWARLVESQMDTHTWRDQREARNTTLHDALDRYWREVASKKKQPDKERSRVRLWQQSKIAEAHLLSIRGGDLAEWRDDRLESGVTGGTVRRDLAMMQHLFNVARKEWKMEGLMNPVDDIRKPPPGKARTQRVSPAEEQALLAAAVSPTVHDLIILALETAMRRSELLGLVWSLIDLQSGTAHLPDTKNNDARTVPLSPRAVGVLEAMPRQMEGTVFCMTRDQVVGAWRRTRKAAELEHIRFHDLRHEGTSRLAESGLFSVLELSAISGHKDMQMLRRYTHPRAGDLAMKMRA